ncbi:MAG TPA: hypothetical protein VGD64_01655 [Acidisarcina sp.]
MIEENLKGARDSFSKYPGFPNELLELGQPRQALLSVEEDIARDRRILGAEGVPQDVAYSNLGYTLSYRAVALFTSGEQEQGMAQIAEAQQMFSRARSLAQGEKEIRRYNHLLDDSFDKLAAMKALIGDWDGCVHSLRETSDHDTESPSFWAKHPNFDGTTNLGLGLLRDCSWLAEARVTGPDQTATATDTSSSIRSQIDQVRTSGRYSALPEPQVTSSGAADGPPSITIKNDTRYNLTVLCAGPTEHSTQIAAGQTSSVRCPEAPIRWWAGSTRPA